MVYEAIIVVCVLLLMEYFKNTLPELASAAMDFLHLLTSQAVLRMEKTAGSIPVAQGGSNMVNGLNDITCK